MKKTELQEFLEEYDTLADIQIAFEDRMCSPLIGFRINNLLWTYCDSDCPSMKIKDFHKQQMFLYSIKRPYREPFTDTLSSAYLSRDEQAKTYKACSPTSSFYIHKRYSEIKITNITMYGSRGNEEDIYGNTWNEDNFSEKDFLSTLDRMDDETKFYNTRDHSSWYTIYSKNGRETDISYLDGEFNWGIPKHHISKKDKDIIENFILRNKRQIVEREDVETLIINDEYSIKQYLNYDCYS